jgi:hypothetical protein
MKSQGSDKGAPPHDSVDPTKAPEFQRVLRNMLSTPPNKHADMKTGKRSPGGVRTDGEDRSKP